MKTSSLKVLPATIDHPFSTMEELQQKISARILSPDGYDFLQENKKHLPCLNIQEVKKSAMGIGWKVGDVLMGDVTNTGQHFHYLLV